MSADRDVTRIVRSWLHEDAREDADRVLNLVLNELDTTPQRRAGWLARRFFDMNGFARFATIAASAVAIVAIGFALVRGGNVGGPSPTESPSSAATPGASLATGPRLLNTLPEGDVVAGTYEIDAVFPVRMTFTLPTGYNRGSGGESWIVGLQNGSVEPGHGIEFQIAWNVYADPCHWALGQPSPRIGPTVDDLVTAMTSMVGFTASEVSDVTVGGLPAKAFDLRNGLDAASCDQGGIRTVEFGDTSDDGPSYVGGDERQRIYVVQVGATRLMIMTYSHAIGDAAAEAAAAAELQKIVESIQFR